MAYFLGLVALLLASAGVLLLISSRLPKLWRIEKAVLVQARPFDLFKLLESWKLWESWSVWNSETEPDIEFKYFDAEFGVGAVQTWTGKLNAQAEILALSPSQLIDYSLSIDNGRVLLHGTLALSPSNDFQTQVAWRISVKDLGPSNGWFVGFKMYFLRNYFEAAMLTSLANLASLFKDSNELAEEEDNRLNEDHNPIP